MKHALILGASGDIGQACAEELAAQGWSLYCHYHQNAEKIKKLIEFLEKKYPQQDFYSLQLDMTQEEKIDDFVQKIFQLDAIIVASGQTVYKLLSETSSKEMDYLWQTLLKTPVLICQKLQTKLSKKNHGRIIFIGSVYGMMGSAMEVMYSTLKGAQHAFVRAYSQEVASTGITVNAVAPGAVNTQMNSDWTAEELQELIEEIPMHRMVEPQEIASLVRYLTEDNAKYITGTIIPVSGGWKI